MGKRKKESPQSEEVGESAKKEKRLEKENVDKEKKPQVPIEEKNSEIVKKLTQEQTEEEKKEDADEEEEEEEEEEQEEEEEEEEEEDDDEEEEEEEEEEGKKKREEEGHLPIMSERRQKFLLLKEKNNLSRKDNRTDLVEEEKKKSLRKGAKVLLKEKRAKREKATEAIKNVDKKELMNVTAEDADWLLDRMHKKNKKSASFGWEVFNEDNQYYSYKRRVQRLQQTAGEDLQKEYEQQKKSVPDFYRGADSLAYGIDPNAARPKKDVDRMANELNAQIEKRKSFSRHRQFLDEADVDYINKRNKVFNEKVTRAFGKYTAEIKQNLERGTAV